MRMMQRRWFCKYFLNKWRLSLRKIFSYSNLQPWGGLGCQGGGQEAHQDRRHPRHQELHREGEDQGGENQQRF